MTLISFENGKVVMRGGKVGSGQACCCNKCSGPCDGENPCPEGCVCVDGECVPDSGACCTCDGDAWVNGNRPPNVPFGAGFCTPEERDAYSNVILGALQTYIDTATEALTSNGWTSAGSEATLFTDSGTTLDPTDRFWNPDCPGEEVYWTSFEWFQVFAQCCGTVDTEADPIDLGFQPTGSPSSAYPCIGPYTNFTCADGVASENCVGSHHPGKTCAEQPCVPVDPCTCESGPEARVSLFLATQPGYPARAFCTPEEREPAYSEDMATAQAKAQEFLDILIANGWECGGPTGTAMADMQPYEYGAVECEGYGPEDFIYTTYPEYATAIARCCGTVDDTAAPLDFGGAVDKSIFLGFGAGYLNDIYPCIPNPLP